ncbi:ABC transporter ATP-binding protein [Nitrincola alkalisediminis]|uniref:ABC transporter ATP-binding protein n=1 Tax=Nitrincola alkalisediminis TaxID=1366656 RepID=UPI001873447F|nr:ABC transporter ATP-binding protein [Nitrincola alkalisediminis]
MTLGLYLDFDLESCGKIPLKAKLHIQPRELVALLGPSGSGKTTLLRSLAGLYTEVTGHIQSGNIDWLNSTQKIQIKPEQRSLGMVFQNYALFPHLTALQNVMLPLFKLSKRDANQKALDWLARVHLSGLELRKPHELSGGQRQRVALARALVAEPRLLLLDEPFSAVDQATRHKLRRELALLRHQIEAPTLLVTHDLEEALQLADRICVLHHGQILQVATPDELMSHPRSPTVARLLGMHNLFKGIVKDVSKTQITLDWCGKTLLITTQKTYKVGQTIEWMATPQSLILHRPDRPSNGDKENPIEGRIEELVMLGPHVSISVRPTHAPELPLRFFIPRHFVERQDLRMGMSIFVSLLGEQLHIFD